MEPYFHVNYEILTLASKTPSQSQIFKKGSPDFFNIWKGLEM